MNEGKQDQVISISLGEQQARLLSSVILEYNDESLSLARDDRENLITFGDGHGNKFPIPFPEGEKDLWKQVRRFRNLIVHGVTRFAEDGSITIHPSEQWKHSKRDADIQPFPNGLGQQVDGVYKYSLTEMKGLAGLFQGMSPRNRLQMSMDAHWGCRSCGSRSPSIVGLEHGSVLEFPCGLKMSYPDGRFLNNCNSQEAGNSPPMDG